MAYGAAVSEHPDAAEAVGEVVGAVLEAVGPEPDLAVLFVADAHVAATGDIAEAVRALLRPRVLLGASAVSVIGGPREVEDQPAISLWAGAVGEARPVRFDAVPGSGEVLGVEALVDEATAASDPASPRLLLLLADPFTFPVDALLRRIDEEHPDLAVLGGLASAGRGPGGNRLVLDGAVHDDGAVGVVLPAGAAVRTVVSQGCRPIGEPFTVTGSERNVVTELGSRPALDRLREIVEALDPDDRVQAQSGLHVGLAIDEHRLELLPGDFLIRAVVGIDPERRAVAVGDLVPIGTTVQFQVRDAESADHDLRSLLAGETAQGALVFTCNGRGRRLFGEPGHDAAVVHEAVDGGAVAGMFCAGELGPVAGRNHAHGFTASIALFTAPADPG